MAGNTVSIMAITTKGRGGRQAETLPRSNRGFTIQEKQNSRFRCCHCNTVLPNNYYGYTECPFCHERNSIVTIGGRETRTRLLHQNMLHDIEEKIRNNPNSLSKKDLAIEFNVSYSTILYLCRDLSDADAALFCDKRGRRKVETKVSIEISAVEEYYAEEEEEIAVEDNIPETQNDGFDKTQSCEVSSEEEKKPLFFSDTTEEAALVAYELKEEGYGAKDIAKLLAVSVGTVYWYIRRIKSSR